MIVTKMLSVLPVLLVISSCAYRGYSLRIPAIYDDELYDIIDWTTYDISSNFTKFQQKPQTQSDSSIAKVTQEPVQWDFERRVFMFGSWHKSGTNLFRQTARLYNSVVNIEQCLNNGCVEHAASCSDRKVNVLPNPRQRTLFVCITTPYYVSQLNALAADNWRGVLVIRDPLSMLVSGYVYHMRTKDCPGCDCTTMKRLDLLEGLQMQAACTRNDVNTLLDAYRASMETPNVMTVRLEYIMSNSHNFNKTMIGIWAHLTSRRIGNASRFVELASRLDLRRNPSPPGADLGGQHVSTKEDVEKALKAVEDLGLDRQLHDARSELGYI